MNSEGGASGGLRAVILGIVLLAGALGGAVVVRLFSAEPQTTAPRPSRPIVQIVRQQPGLPDIADLIDRLCPSMATIVPQGADVPVASGSALPVPASQYSADGWLVTSAAHLPQMPLDAVFADGRRAQLSDLRTDPVSGLAIVKASAPGTALPFSDQAFPRVGQFGFTLAAPAGSGCSAASSMIGSDFLADGGGKTGYVRLETTPDGWTAGTPLIGTDGRVIGIGTENPLGAVIPAPMVSVILDELIRGSLSPSTSFGFRVVDYAPPLANRLGNVRSGAGVALIQPKSPAAAADLEAGDIILAVNDVPVSSASELNRALDAQSNKATLTVQRRSQQLTISVRRVSGK